ncbi:MAG: bifunctional phosphopantothenoylcysteine decarboxylase/phosphopantothenate--cysteine ligase CoaBC [Thermoplasmata archaeon]
MHPSEAIRASEGEELLGKTIVLGVCGSIAAVETVKLARELIRHGADVYPVMTDAARIIIHPNALEFATGRVPVQQLDGSVQHVDLCGSRGNADLLLLAPATANTISKMAQGIDDTAVTTFATTALGSGLPIIVAPAMDVSMYDHPILKENMEKLRGLNVEFVEPLLEEEKAKLADTEVLTAHVIRKLGPTDMKGKRVLIIAGATEEPLDDVRVLTNRSTGETGLELARAAFLRGATVDLWMGRCSVQIPSYLKTWRFQTTEQLLSRVGEADHDFCLVPAAISDYVPQREEGKIPSKAESLILELKPNVQVLSRIREVCKHVLVGFKLESQVQPDELIQRARTRMKELKLDYVVANDIGQVKEGRTEVILIDGRGRSKEFKGSKREVAWDLWSAVLHGLEG